MGKRHCRNKQEVLQMMYDREREKRGPQPQEAPLKRIMKTANRNREAVERARKNMRKGGTGSGSDNAGD